MTKVVNFPAREASCEPFPEALDARLTRALQDRGIRSLFCHQGDAWRAVREKKGNALVCTETASGKTLCYNLPVIDQLLADQNAFALYVFPTKALAQDQLAELRRFENILGRKLDCYIYDGDTPADARRKIRDAGRIVLTNPDMLHTGILPHHTRWARFIEGLKYVILDEVHVYRGVFGSHFANVLRRLERICTFYESSPQYIATSATIGNPGELAEKLSGTRFEVISRSGAPAGEKKLVFYNPPVVNNEFGLRRSYVKEAQWLAAQLILGGLKTIVFTPSRLSTEVLVNYLRKTLEKKGGDPTTVSSYRGGYLPQERREIERSLRDGDLSGVVATNALELGIDIGGLDACVLASYPGSISSTWQRAGRVGRKLRPSVAFLIARNHPLDQFMVSHPDYFMDQPCEIGRIDPDNLLVLADHLKCAAFEMPFSEGDRFGGRDISEIMEALAAEGILHHSRGMYHYTSDVFPASEVNLRMTNPDNFVILEQLEGDATRTIGEIDYQGAPSLVHPKAIYNHQGEQFYVESLDWKEQKAVVKKVTVDYYTDAITYDEVTVLDSFDRKVAGDLVWEHGEAHVANRVVGFKKIRFYTGENLGCGEVVLPQQEMHTTACWFSPNRELLMALNLEWVEIMEALSGLAELMRDLAAVFLLCDRHDLGSALGDRNGRWYYKPRLSGGMSVEAMGAMHESIDRSEEFIPTVFLYDNHPGGVG
ncbi:MAG: DEAD/DEAH box helicase, partial [bacterium]|nr:DEAD/DEAH box helicase [bacterium]